MKYLIECGDIYKSYEADSHIEAVHKAIPDSFNCVEPLGLSKVIMCLKEGDDEGDAIYYLTNKILDVMGYKFEEFKYPKKLQ